MLLINEEYKKFLNQRDAIKNYIHDTNKKLISNLYDMELPNLNNILLSKFTLTQDTNLTCLLCKKFVGINKKSLSKHKQTCAKNNNHTVSDENSPINDSSVNDILTDMSADILTDISTDISTDMPKENEKKFKNKK
jgi:DNA-binding protein Fis